MIITWTDTNMDKHEIDLSKAVVVEVNGISLSSNKDGSLSINTKNAIEIKPSVQNSITVKDVKR